MPDFDVVVVGAGSAGCVVAGTLCQRTDLSVCLVEAGPDYGPLNSGRWPAELLDPRASPRTHDWGYVAERADDSNMPEYRAKVIGGCSSHNECGAVWGMPDDYDRWAEAGNPGWSYRELAPLIDQVERASPQSWTLYRGRNGAVRTQQLSDEELPSWARYFLKTAVAAGCPRLSDLSVPDPEEGVGTWHVNVARSVRLNASFAFLDPMRERANLTIMSETIADRLVMQQDGAIKLVCQSKNKVFEITSQAFVLSAGVYGSPLILMRSGIGPKEHLKEVGIPVQLDLPGVGQNLHDHYGVRIGFQPSQAGRLSIEEDVARGLYGACALRAMSSRSRTGFDLHIFPYLDWRGRREVGVDVFNMAPLSRGTVLLRGQGLLLPPRIDFQFFTDPENRDIAVVSDGLHLARRLARSEPLATLIAHETKPGEGVTEEDELRSFVLGNAEGYAHAVGTCKVGPPSDWFAVADHTGRIYGTTNVYVADGSIIPQIPRANTNLTCMLIGLRIADLLIRHEVQV